MSSYLTVSWYFSVGFNGQKYSYSPVVKDTVFVFEEVPFATGAAI
jgi:hypothetical protein